MFKPISRQEYHKLKWKWIIWKDNCPFCDLRDNNINHTIWVWKYWHIINNISSYSWDYRHIMAVPNDHIIYSKDLTINHYSELKIVYNEVEKYLKWENYFSFTRESLANRSVEHLHIHFLVWELQWKFLRKMLELQWYPIVQELKI